MDAPFSVYKKIYAKLRSSGVSKEVVEKIIGKESPAVDYTEKEKEFLKELKDNYSEKHRDTINFVNAFIRESNEIEFSWLRDVEPIFDGAGRASAFASLGETLIIRKRGGALKQERKILRGGK